MKAGLCFVARQCKAGRVPKLDELRDLDEQLTLGEPWNTVVWDDPINLMTYVSWVFRSYFGFSQARADELMLQVHHHGRATVATGTREEMERHVVAMHGYGLLASLTRSER
ncbi:ATP-dependent Clp protease adapter ClpS [Mycetocola zhujimingii]|uniref:ATP-dependent Clp protease adapter ClpS n=1 Tax=Mycetocola zhujimingii TaxID=2079792 RepID=A0A2U1TCC2_9MICO|nr:ATP-dependent Clp protease adapter ClpS [Mycetocola zhujimingii]PWC06535.1 ATP-dependent Clp protease adapter ClpS [Mycetocola zhujimingii]